LRRLCGRIRQAAALRDKDLFRLAAGLYCRFVCLPLGVALLRRLLLSRGRGDRESDADHSCHARNMQHLPSHILSPWFPSPVCVPSKATRRLADRIAAYVRTHLLQSARTIPSHQDAGGRRREPAM
jgi:hypothetical protein